MYECACVPVVGMLIILSTYAPSSRMSKEMEKERETQAIEREMKMIEKEKEKTQRIVKIAFVEKL